MLVRQRLEQPRLGRLLPIRNIRVNASRFYKYEGGCRAFVLFTSNPIVQQVYIMLRVNVFLLISIFLLLILCICNLCRNTYLGAILFGLNLFLLVSSALRDLVSSQDLRKKLRNLKFIFDFIATSVFDFQVSFILCAVPAVFGIIVSDPPPSPNDYKYSYNIEDPTTGDSKSQHEVRQGDVVTGAYTVLGPDGTKRTVEYTADAKHGFKAVLREDPGNPPLVTQPPVPRQNYNTIPYQTPRPLYAQYQTPAPRLEHVQYQTPSSPRPEYVQYQTPTPRTVYEPVLHLESENNYIEEQPTVYFTPQNEVEPRAPFDGQYFIPATANNKY